MKGRHQADLAWRFQHADEAQALGGAGPSALAALADVCLRGAFVAGRELGTSDTEARVSAGERARRIDRALGRLPRKPVKLARVLELRYGPADSVPEIRLILREHAPVAAITPEAMALYAASMGRAPRADSPDVERWLAEMCERIRRREASGADTVAIDEIRRAGEALVADAESAYEEAAEGARAGERFGAGKAPRKLKAFYTLRELARALGMSRWTVRRWLDASRIPYELRRSPGGTRGGRILVMVSELRTYAPSYFASIREELEES